MNSHHPSSCPSDSALTGKFAIGDRVKHGSDHGAIYDIQGGWYLVKFDGKNPHCCPHYAEHELEPEALTTDEQSRIIADNPSPAVMEKLRWLDDPESFERLLERVRRSTGNLARPNSE